MKYACLVYYREAEIGQMSPSDWHALNLRCVAFGKQITASGHRLGGGALEPTSTATTVRVRNGKVTATDGPFAETKEQLAGFYLIDAKDLDEAIEVASRIPPAQLGSIEIRPVRELPRPPE
ncbi:MAG TPA: YciI family protein [Gammaproteobacteria bacterium]